jgi:hypothetical protein
MGNILAKIGHFFEAHVEKIVLIIAGVLALWLTMIRVVFSPNVVEFDNQTFSPKRIDSHIYNEMAKDVEVILNGEPVPPPEGGTTPLTSAIDPCDPIIEGIHGDMSRGFAGFYDSPLAHLDVTKHPPLPRNSSSEKTENRNYRLPEVGEVTEVLVNHIRAAAYFPVGDLTDEQSYEDAEHEPNDLDLVTVQAKFDLAALRERFFDRFAGDDLPERWRDENYAEPIVANVNLQRQVMKNDGAWSEWETMPRLAIEHREVLLRNVYKASELPPGGVQVLALKLKDREVRLDMLQPRAYDIASAHEDWFPPELYDEYQTVRKKVVAQEKREERESEKQSQNTGRTGSRSSRRGGTRSGGTATRGGSRGGGAEDMMYGGGGEMGMGGGRGTRGSSRRGGRTSDTATGRNRSGRGRAGTAQDDMMMGYGMEGEMGRGAGTRNRTSVDDVYLKLNDLRLDMTTDFEKLDSFTFWAHDDRLVPGLTYRYRVRLGVLNPVAGSGNVGEADAALADDVVLWSDFSEVTPSISVPKRLYFFAKTYKEGTQLVNVDVAKFHMGYWNLEAFPVKPGEEIGKIVEPEEEEDARRTTMDYGMEGAMYGNMGMNRETESDAIDYRTSALYVGTRRVDGWTGKVLRSQISHDMLYTVDGKKIDYAPISSKGWTDAMSASFRLVNTAMREPKEPFRSFGESQSKVNRGNMGMMEMYGDTPYGY